MKRTFKGTILSVAALVVLSLAAAPVGALPIRQDSYAWGDKIGWINFSTTNGGVQVAGGKITGFAWGDGSGWINFGPFHNAPGVSVSSTGAVSGYAWSSTLGWISFANLRIDTYENDSRDGILRGIAGSSTSNAGQISFDCATCSVIVSNWNREARVSPDPDTEPSPGTPPGEDADPTLPEPETPDGISESPEGGAEGEGSSGGSQTPSEESSGRSMFDTAKEAARTAIAAIGGGVKATYEAVTHLVQTYTLGSALALIGAVILGLWWWIIAWKRRKRRDKDDKQ